MLKRPLRVGLGAVGLSAALGYQGWRGPEDVRPMFVGGEARLGAGPAKGLLYTLTPGLKAEQEKVKNIVVLADHSPQTPRCCSGSGGGGTEVTRHPGSVPPGMSYWR